LKKRFGQRLKHLRQLANLTQLELAEKVGISDRYLGRMERGLVSPSFECIEKIARALDKEPESLFTCSQGGSARPAAAAPPARPGQGHGPGLWNFPGMTIKHVTPDLNIVWVASQDPNSPCNKRTDCVGRRCHEVFQNRPEPCPGCPLPETLATGLAHEKELASPSGKTFITRSEAIIGDGGRVMGGVHMALDITERRHVEDALRQAQLRLEHLFATGPVVLYSCEAGGDYLATYISENVRQVFGHPPEAFLATPEYWQSHLYPGERERLQAGLPQLFEHGRLVHEYRFRHGNGGWRWLRDEMRLVRGPGGEPVEIVGSWMDVTDAKAWEMVMRDSQSRYRTLFEANCTVQLLIDAETMSILDANPAACAYYGYAHAQMRKMSIDDLNMLPTAELADALTLASGSGKNLFRFRHRLANGDIREVESRVTPMQHGGRTMIHSMIIDITDRERAEKEARASTALWEVLFENAPDKVALLDSGQRIVRSSRLFAEAVGIAPDKIPGTLCEMRPVPGAPSSSPHDPDRVSVRLDGHDGAFQALRSCIAEECSSQTRTLITLQSPSG